MSGKFGKFSRCASACDLTRSKTCAWRAGAATWKASFLNLVASCTHKARWAKSSIICESIRSIFAYFNPEKAPSIPEEEIKEFKRKGFSVIEWWWTILD